MTATANNAVVNPDFRSERRRNKEDSVPENDYEDAMYELNARYDDQRERYGDPCPGCGTLRWQGDCPKCMKDEPEDGN